MSITLNWPAQTDQGLTAIEIYRDTKRIDTANPGAPLATLGPTEVTYVDNGVVENTNYFYSVAAVKAGNRTFSVPRCIPYLSNWGVPDSAGNLPRGSMDAALLGYVANGVMPDPVALWAMVPELAPLTKGMWAGWHKFIHNGKVLFISDTSGTIASYTQLNNLGLVFGEDNPAKLPAHAAVGVNHKRIVTIGGSEYILRLPKMSALPLSQYITTLDQTVDSELRDGIARLYQSNTVLTAARATSRSRLGDLTGIFTTLTQHLSTAANAVKMGGTTNQNEELTTTPIGTAAAARWVLELIP